MAHPAFHLRIESDDDPRMWTSPHALLGKIISERIRSGSPEAEFPLPWTKVVAWSKWTISRRKAQRFTRRLVEWGYLKPGSHGAKGTHARHYVLVIKGVNFDAVTGVDKSVNFDAVTGVKGVKIDAPLYSKSFRQGIDKGKSNGSLRSQAGDGEKTVHADAPADAGAKLALNQQLQALRSSVGGDAP